VIKINLLPIKAKQRQYTVVYQLVVGGVVLLTVLMFCAVDHIVQKNNESRLVANREKMRREITELERLIGEVKQFEQKKTELQRKLDVITNLKNNKVGPVHLLEELSVTVPKKLWLETISESTTPPAGHNIQLTGKAISDEVIAEFMQKLEESEYFSNVNLIVAQAAGEQSGVALQAFQMTAEMHIPVKKPDAKTN
jgi:type IV pilus assembly protein PilN